jgi:hypothetical protein
LENEAAPVHVGDLRDAVPARGVAAPRATGKLEPVARNGGRLHTAQRAVGSGFAQMGGFRPSSREAT